MGWIRRLWDRSLIDKRLDSELRFHLEQQTAAYISSGISPAAARRRANLEFGGIERFKEECRDVRAETRLHEFLYDLRYAWHSLRKDLRFSLLAVFALTIGIGCSTIIFSIVYNGVLQECAPDCWLPLPVQNSPYCTKHAPLSGAFSAVGPDGPREFRVRSACLATSAAINGVPFASTHALFNLSKLAVPVAQVRDRHRTHQAWSCAAKRLP